MQKPRITAQPVPKTVYVMGTGTPEDFNVPLLQDVDNETMIAAFSNIQLGMDALNFWRTDKRFAALRYSLSMPLIFVEIDFEDAVALIHQSGADYLALDWKDGAYYRTFRPTSTIDPRLN